MTRNATAVWQGTGKEGKGHITTQSHALNNTQYHFKSRFEDGVGTNPEELMAAAHAGCFTMKLAFELAAAGFAANELNTTCAVSLEDGAISKSALSLEAEIREISEEKFQEIAKKAKETCPVSKAYNCEITLEAKLK